MNRLWKRLRHDLANALIIVLAWAAVVEAAVSNADIKHAVQIPIAPFLALPLLLRKRYPVAAPVLVFAAAALDATLDPRGTNALNVVFFCVLTAQVLAGAIPDRNQSIMAGAADLAAAFWVQSRFPHTGVGDYVWVVFFFSATWVAGRAFATRTHQARELRERVEAAERAREVAAEESAAEERARIARELHDVVAHSVSVMVVQASGVRRLLTDDQHRERDALLSVEQIGRQALTEMRRMLGVMRTGEEPAAALTPQPGLQHLDRLIAQVEEAGLPVELHVEGERPELAPGVDLSAYRIVQEGLTNALKHARGSRAEVVVRFVDHVVQLEVSDDGPGAAEGDGMGHGLVGMRERVALYGGTLEAGNRDGGGFVLRAELPVEVRS